MKYARRMRQSGAVSETEVEKKRAEDLRVQSKCATTVWCVCMCVVHK